MPELLSEPLSLGIDDHGIAHGFAEAGVVVGHVLGHVFLVYGLFDGRVGIVAAVVGTLRIDQQLQNVLKHHLFGGLGVKLLFFPDSAEIQHCPNALMCSVRSVELIRFTQMGG